MSYRDTECDACGKPWDIHLIMGCVHEHSGHVRFCREHRSRLVATADQYLCCTPCINDHPCRTHVVRVIEDRSQAA